MQATSPNSVLAASEDLGGRRRHQNPAEGLEAWIQSASAAVLLLILMDDVAGPVDAGRQAVRFLVLAVEVLEVDPLDVEAHHFQTFHGESNCPVEDAFSQCDPAVELTAVVGRTGEWHTKSSAVFLENVGFVGDILPLVAGMVGGVWSRKGFRDTGFSGGCAGRLKVAICGEGKLWYEAGEAARLRKGLLEGRVVVRLGEFCVSAGGWSRLAKPLSMPN